MKSPEYLENKLEIHNIVLEKYNIMESKSKLFIILVLIGAASFSIGLWAYSTQEPLNVAFYVMAAAVAIIVLLSMYFAYNSFKSEKAGLPAEDELSKRIKEKAASKAFNLSIYMWTFAAMFIVDTGIRAELIIGLGIMGMGLIFLVTWFYLSKTGISDADQD